MNILLTGATGYVGGCLLPELLRRGHSVRCMVRRPDAFRQKAERIVLDVGCPTERLSIVQGDATDEASLATACAGIDAAYWMVHSMESGVDFERADRLAAERFATAAAAAGVRRIVYLGGLGADDDRLSAHLRSRHEVGAILRAAAASSSFDVIELRASIVIGPGSFSFDLVRTLVERLPVMICPAWLATPTQPIAIDDVVAYLAASIELSPGESRIFEIGGPDVVSYGAIMREYARQRGLRRLMIPVPVLTPRLSSLWLKLVAPRYSKVGRKLIDGLKNPTVVTSHAAVEAFPVRPLDLEQAVAAAIRTEDAVFAGRHWADEFEARAANIVASKQRTSKQRSSNQRYGGRAEGARLIDHRMAVVSVEPSRAFAAIERIGGDHGWYAFDWLWGLRGWMDTLVGGPGMGRGRRDPHKLAVGDTLDCWKVEVCEPPRRLRLAAEMKMPGRGWLEFELVPRDGDTTIHQTAIFDPKGLGGLAYWYAIWPLHELVFRGMLAGIAKSAVRG